MSVKIVDISLLSKLLQTKLAKKKLISVTIAELI